MEPIAVRDAGLENVRLRRASGSAAVVNFVPYLFSRLQDANVICRLKEVLDMKAHMRIWVDYSDWNTRAVGVRAAIRPGMMATMFANASAPIPTMMTDRTGTVGYGTT